MILSPISGRNRDDISDDNPDDSYTPNAAHNNDLRLLYGPFRIAAWSWQCGGQGFGPLSSTYLTRCFATAHRE